MGKAFKREIGKTFQGMVLFKRTPAQETDFWLREASEMEWRVTPKPICRADFTVVNAEGHPYSGGCVRRLMARLLQERARRCSLK